MLSRGGGKKPGQRHLRHFQTTTYFGDASKNWMINFRVRNLDAMAAQLRAAGISVEIDQERCPNGRFAPFERPGKESD